jgi:cell division protein FtsB
MSDDSAFWGVWMLSEQLSDYRLLDALERARYNNELAVDNAFLNRDLDQLVARYNRLVGQYNELSRRANYIAKEGDRRIAELQREKAALQTECDRLRLENHDKETQIRLLDEVVRRDHPERYLVG